MRIFKQSIPIFCLFLFPAVILASWYDQKLEGWYYFEDPKITQEQPSATPEEADNYISIKSKELKQLLSLSIVFPTEENLTRYITEQRKWIQQSNAFAHQWEKTLLEHPELGDFLTTPTSSYGILTQKALDIQKSKELLQQLSQDYFLLFFFKGSDPLSQKSAEVLQLFSATHGWQYKAVSLDGIGIPQLETFELDKGISQLFTVRATPSLFIVNPTQMEVYPVGAGLLSVSEIEHNIQTQFEGVSDEN